MTSNLVNQILLFKNLIPVFFLESFGGELNENNVEVFSFLLLLTDVFMNVFMFLLMLNFL